MLHKVHNEDLSFNIYWMRTHYSFEYIHKIILLCGKMSNNLFVSCHIKVGFIQNGLISENLLSFIRSFVHRMILNFWDIIDMKNKPKQFKKQKKKYIFYTQCIRLIPPSWMHGYWTFLHYRSSAISKPEYSVTTCH